MYSDTHNIADLTNEELYRMRDYGKFEYDREAAAAELARREQAAQPEAQPTPKSWLKIMHDRHRDRATELAAENERLRGLLAQCASAFDAVIDNQIVTDEQFAAIEAAKEAAHAK